MEVRLSAGFVSGERIDITATADDEPRAILACTGGDISAYLMRDLKAASEAWFARSACLMLPGNGRWRCTYCAGMRTGTSCEGCGAPRT